MRSLLVVGAPALVVLAGCGAAPHTRAAGAVAPLAVRTVAWNPSSAPVGHVRAVADTGNVVAVFGDAGATVLASGAVAATDPSVTDWVRAETITGADGTAQWIVGIDGRGHLYYLRGLSSFENVSARYGLDGRVVRGAAMLDAGRVGFLLDQEIAVADGRRVTRYPAPGLQDLGGGGGHGVGVGPEGLVFFDPAPLATRSYALRGVAGAAVGPDGRLYAATRRAVYATKPDGELTLVYDAEADTLHGLVASGGHVWFADGTELGVVDGDHVAETAGAHVASDATLAPSSSGDVWVLAAGALQRFARVDAEPALAASWATTLAPIFARSCSACHLPHGASGTDLSTAEDWESERSAIRDRIVVSKTMPPEGHPLSDQDRQAIGAWVAGHGNP
jgi:mono/diheme cytochrome c family protein